MLYHRRQTGYLLHNDQPCANASTVIRDTPQSCGLPPIEVYKKEAWQVKKKEQELNAKQIFIDYG